MNGISRPPSPGGESVWESVEWFCGKKVANQTPESRPFVPPCGADLRAGIQGLRPNLMHEIYLNLQDLNEIHSGTHAELLRLRNDVLGNRDTCIPSSRIEDGKACRG